MTDATGRLDRIVADLELLQQEADEILNTYTDQLMTNAPSGTSWGVTKYKQLALSAGSTINRVAALKILKNRFLAGE